MTTTEPLEDTEQQRREIVAMAREFAQNELAPYAAEWDRKAEFPAAAHRKLADLGFFGMRIPVPYDGLGLDMLTYLMVLEELTVGDAGTAISLSVHNSLPAYMLCEYGTEEQNDRWLRPMARGEMLAAFSLSEAGSGSDAASLTAKATRDGDAWILSGEKAWVTNGDTADIAVTMLRTGSGESGAHGISCFVVPLDADGVEAGKPEDKMGLRSSHTTTLALHDVRLTAGHLLGEEGMGFAYAMASLDRARLGVAAQAVGIATAALDHSIRYSSERRQFGTALKDFEAIQFKLANMATRIAAARALLHEVARSHDRGEDTTTAASMAKLFASETAMWVTTEAVQIFGGYGYMRDYPVERLFRDAKVTEIYEGTSEIQRVVIARGLSGESG